MRTETRSVKAEIAFTCESCVHNIRTDQSGTVTCGVCGRVFSVSMSVSSTFTVEAGDELPDGTTEPAGDAPASSPDGESPGE